MQLPIPVPTPDETCERFAIRAHRGLMQSVPDPDQRNQIIEQQWRKHRGPMPEDQIAARTFPQDRFARVPGVCVFAEHSAIDGQGNPRKYDLAEMCRIVRSNNFRIRDFGGFAPISDGHTPDPDDPVQEDPDILGYAGPYRLGMIGRENPRWAIFADEWHMRDCAQRLAKKPRRSVELWTFAHDPKRTHFDPIAAIGADTPRLPLPVKFSRHSRDGVLVERYTFSAPASFSLPGGSNTHVKKFERSECMLSNEDISQLLSALQETPQFKYIDSMMAKEGTGNGNGNGEGEPTQYADDLPMEDEDAPAVPAMGEEEENGDLHDLSDLIVPEQDEEEEPVRNMRMPAKHTRRSGRNQPARVPSPDPQLAVKYTRLQRAHNTLVQEHGRMASQLSAVVRRSTDAERTAAVMELANKYPDFVELEDELDRVLYSRKANLSDEEFTSHVATVEKYAQRAEMATRAHAPEIPRGHVDRGRPVGDAERYAAKVATEAVRIHTDAVNAGKSGYTWEEAKSEAEKRLKSA